jgi:hypothetical protein
MLLAALSWHWTVIVAVVVVLVVARIFRTS